MGTTPIKSVMWYLLGFETVVRVVSKFMNVKAKPLRDSGFKMRDSDELMRHRGLFLSLHSGKKTAFQVEKYISDFSGSIGSRNRGKSR